MTFFRRKISEFTLKLQRQNVVPVWSIANEGWVYEVVTENKYYSGKKWRVIYSFMCFFDCDLYRDIFIFFVGFFYAINFFLKVGIKLTQSGFGNFSRVFVGMGAASEEYIYNSYSKGKISETLRVNSITLENIQKLGKPSLFSVIFLIFSNAFGYSKKLKKIEFLPNQSINGFLVVCAINIGVYCFYRAYWDTVKRACGIKEVVFLTMDICAMACIDAGLKVIYLQHGLITLSVVMPKVPHIFALTKEEEKYLSLSLENSIVCMQSQQEFSKKIIFKNRLIILSPDLYVFHYREQLDRFISFLKSKNFEIIFRPTPRCSRKNMLFLQKKFPDVLFDDRKLPFEKSICKWRPKLVAGWDSTGLATALLYGCLPISLLNPNEETSLLNMIYPMREKALFWPIDKVCIEEAMFSKKFFHSRVERLRRQVDAEL